MKNFTKSDRRAINIAVVRNRELWHTAVKARNGVRRELGPSPRVCDNCFNGIIHDCLDGNRCQPKLKEYSDRRIALAARTAEDHARVCFWNYQNALELQKKISSGKQRSTTPIKPVWIPVNQNDVRAMMGEETKREISRKNTYKAILVFIVVSVLLSHFIHLPLWAWFLLSFPSGIALRALENWLDKRSGV